jgi:hypothetical protein
MRSTVIIAEEYGTKTMIWTNTFPITKFFKTQRALLRLKENRIKNVDAVEDFLSRESFKRQMEISPSRLICSAELLVLWFDMNGKLRSVDCLRPAAVPGDKVQKPVRSYALPRRS